MAVFRQNPPRNPVRRASLRRFVRFLPPLCFGKVRSAGAKGLSHRCGFRCAGLHRSSSQMPQPQVAGDSNEKRLCFVFCNRAKKERAKRNGRPSRRSALWAHREVLRSILCWPKAFWQPIGADADPQGDGVLGGEDGATRAARCGAGWVARAAWIGRHNAGRVLPPGLSQEPFRAGKEKVSANAVAP